MAEQRPIVTSRVLHNVIKFDEVQDLYQAFPYCGYSFRDGPWSDTLIAFKVDPREHPKYRIFQTYTFPWTYEVFLPPTWEEEPNPFYGDESQKISHIFDGK